VGYSVGQALQTNDVPDSVSVDYGVYQGSIKVVLSGETPAYFLAIVGIDSLPISGRARCLIPQGTFKPIAVRMSAVEHSLGGGSPEEYEILGSSPKWDLADVESGKNFRGAVFLHMRCKSIDDVPVENCPAVDVFDPLDAEPPSPQSVKDLAEACFENTGCNIRHPAGSYLPIVSGTSNKFLVEAFCSTGCFEGQLVAVLIFDGTVYDPDPGYGNWENVKIIGFAVYEIVEIDTNTIIAKLHSGPFNSLDDLDIEIDPREIPWKYGS
jgi:hypothetical protein